MNGKRNIGATLILFLTAAIWGSSFVFQKYAVEQLPAAFIVAGRFTIAGILLLVITAKNGRPLTEGAFGAAFWLVLRCLWGRYCRHWLWGLERALGNLLS